MDKAISKPDAMGTLLARAAQLRQAGDLVASLTSLRQAAHLAPDDPHILHDLGLMLLKTGQASLAVAPLKKATTILPSFAHAHWRLGLALENSDDPNGAIASYKVALSHDASLYGAEYRLACLLEVAGHRKAAADGFRRAAARQPKPASFVTKAQAMRAEQRTDDAERSLRRAIAHDPKHAPAQAILGDILSDAGRFEEASACYAAALENAPGMVQVYYNFARCRRLTAADAALVDAMRSSLAIPSAAASSNRAVTTCVWKGS